MRFVIKSVLISVASLALVFSASDSRLRRMKSAQPSGPIKEIIEQKKNSTEVLTPLTEEERGINAGDLILNQPDFVADITYFRSEVVSGGGGSMRIARKENRYREESEFWTFIDESGKPAARLFPENKTYDDLEPVHNHSVNCSFPFDPKTLAFEPGITFKLLGTVIIDGQRSLKIGARRKAKSEEIYLYAARDLNNLILVAQVIKPGCRFIQRLSNISLEVPSNLVEIPHDYKPVEHDRWTKVEAAKLTYKGKPSKDYGVFRSPGGELFIWVNDAQYTWHYLVRPQEARVETAFQGLLVTKSGKYIWQSKETEAFSLTDYQKRKREEYQPEESRRVIVTPNSVKFRSNDYKENRAMIEVHW